MTHIAPPLQTTWWDVPTTVTTVLARLRLRAGDVDEARITAAVPVAGEMINDHLDRHLDEGDDEPPPTAVMQEALVQLVVELVGRRDVALTTGAGLRTVSADVDTQPDLVQLQELLVSLLPLKQRWGVA